MDKLYKPAVIILLAAILGVQAYASFAPKTDACLLAIDEASAVAARLDTAMLSSLSDYDAAVYDRADNINQQTFLAIEQSYLLQQATARMQNAALAVQAACN